MTTKKGFTLIELLVVITIIAIISSIGMVMYQEGQKVARDTRRKQDLRSIQGALTIYYQKNNRYPRTCDSSGVCTYNLSSAGGTWINDDISSPKIPLDTNYINSVPQDPKSDDGNPLISTSLGYAYWSGPITGTSCPQDSTGGGGQYYILAVSLENSSDDERNEVKNYQDCAGNTITGENRAFIITSQD